MKNYIQSIIIAVAVVITALVLTNAFRNRYRVTDSINVTGLGKKDFVSDLVVWSGSFTRKSMDLKVAYEELNKDKEIIRQYLLDNSISETDFVFSSIDIFKEYDYSYEQNGREIRTFTGQRLTQRIQIESKEVDKIESLSRDITTLINKGIEFSSYEPQYYYTGLAELKIEMIAAATEDGRQRAEKIAENSGARLGKLKSANMGVFQIIAQNSNEDYTWGGAYNTTSKRKTATITMKLQFGIR